MAAQKFLKHQAGRIKEQSAVQVGGTPDAIVALNSEGLLDVTMMPVGIGADTGIGVASETLNAGDFVQFWDDAGTPKVRKAIAQEGFEAGGFVLAGSAAGAPATVYFEGKNNQLSGLTIGARYYLSAATAGEVTATPPAVAGDVVQFIGVAINATTISFEGTDGIVLA